MLISEAMKKESEDNLWGMWLTLYPKMNKDNFESFEDYKKRAAKNTPRATELTEEDIMAEMLPIVAAHKKMT